MKHGINLNNIFIYIGEEIEGGVCKIEQGGDEHMGML